MLKRSPLAIALLVLFGWISHAIANTPLPCVPDGHAAAPIFDRPNIDLKTVESQAGLIGAAWANGTGAPEGASLSKDPIIPGLENEAPVTAYLLNGGPSAFMSLKNDSGVISYSGTDGKWHEVDDYDNNPFVNGCIHLRVCWTVRAWKIYTPPPATGKVGVGGKGISAGAEFPIGHPRPVVYTVDLSFCEEKELCPC